MKMIAFAGSLFGLISAASAEPDMEVDRKVSNTQHLARGTTVLRAGSGCTYTTIQAAIDAVPTDGSAMIRLRDQYFGENLSIANKSVELIGGHADCTTSTATGTSTISGVSDGASTILIDNARWDPQPSSTIEVYLQNLDIQNGRGATFGGGIQVRSRHDADFSAKTDLTLDNTWVTDNSASSGGGISLRNSRAGGDGGQIQLFNGSRIYGNQGSSIGGGLHCQGNFVIHMLGGDISGNVAGSSESPGRGGGLHISSCTLTWFAEGSDAGTGSLHANKAHSHGGGLFAQNGAQISLIGAHFAFTPTSTRPFDIHNNQTSRGDGGAIHATGVSTEVIVDRGWIHDNVGDWYGGAMIARDGAQIIVEQGSEVCHDRRNCSRIFNNRTNVAGGGAASVSGEGSNITIRKTVLYNNKSGISDSSKASLAAFGGGSLRLEDSLVHGPAGPSYTFYSNNGRIRIDRSTVADTLPDNAVFFLQGDEAVLRIYDAIIHEASIRPMLATGTGTPSVYADCVVWHDNGLEALGTITRTTVADPMFVNRTAGRFYLVTGSPAINYCDIPPPSPGVDLEWHSRGIEHSGQPMVYGPFDLGAYEFPDRLFSDRLEAP